MAMTYEQGVFGFVNSCFEISKTKKKRREKEKKKSDCCGQPQSQ